VKNILGSVTQEVLIIPAGMETGGRESDVAVRLRHLRAVLGERSAKAFAARLGIEYKRWNNFENGSPLSRDAAFILVKAVPGLTLDWLYFGERAGLSYDLAVRLDRAASNGKASTKDER
jgi:hypothetical protein